MIALAGIALIAFFVAICLLARPDASLKRLIWCSCATLFVIGIIATVWGVSTFRNPISGVYFVNVTMLLTFAVAPALAGGLLGVVVIALLNFYGHGRSRSGPRDADSGPKTGD